MTAEEQARIRLLAVRSEAWRQRKAAVVAAIQDLDYKRSVAIGLLRSIENEEAKAIPDQEQMIPDRNKR